MGIFVAVEKLGPVEGPEGVVPGWLCRWLRFGGVGCVCLCFTDRLGVL